MPVILMLRKGRLLIDDGLLVENMHSGELEFSQDVVFASPSAAAAVILNRNSNGRTEWEVAGVGKTLKEWQESRIPDDIETLE